MEGEHQEADLDNFAQIDISGLFVKHDFDHMIIMEDDASELEKFT